VVAPRRTAMKKRLLILLLFGVIAGIATGYFYIQLNKPLASTAVNQDSSGSFQVSEGASLNKVLSSLVEQGIVDTPLWVFKVYARLTSSEGTIKTGEYSLDKTQTTITCWLRYAQVKLLRALFAFLKAGLLPCGEKALSRIRF